MKILFLGDMAFIGKYSKNDQVTRNRLINLKQMISGADFCVANLESPFAYVEKTVVCKSVHLKTDPNNVTLLKWLGISAVSLANNHFNDYGKIGVRESLQTLDSANIEWMGIQNKSVLYSGSSSNVRISAFCCYSTNADKYDCRDPQYGVQLLSRENLERQLEKDKKAGEYSVLVLHWGDEHTNYPKYEHIQLMKHLRDKYEFVVIGHHPHVVQGVMQDERGMVAYSLGNCIFDDCSSIDHKRSVCLTNENRKSLAVCCEFQQNKLIGCEYIGFFNGEDGIEPYNIEKELETYSNQICCIGQELEYTQMRKQQISSALTMKFGRHDMKWLMNRLNYYTIGARIQRFLNEREYEKIKKEF